MPPAWIGRCAAGLSLGGGRIVILHAGKRLHEGLPALRHAAGQNVGTLSDVVDEDHDVTRARSDERRVLVGVESAV